MNDKNQTVHREVVRRIFEQVWSDANFDTVDQLVAADAQFHIRDHTLPTGPEDLRRVVTGWHQRFANFRFEILDMAAEGDLVAVRLMLSGRHHAQWQDIPATGNKVAVTAMMFLRFEAGRVVEIWETFDEFGMRQQLQTTNEED
jgi:predicted ester cyclase